ncbi:MAG: V-type ATP synthase subunit D [Cyclobacteriaceae bacterium]
MAIKIQYNKSAIQQYQRQLEIREKALPTLKNKETALRMEVKKAGQGLEDKKRQLEEEMQKLEDMDRFWVEFPELIQIKNAEVSVRNIAGVKIPVLSDVHYAVAGYALFSQPAWVPTGLAILKKIIKLRVEIKITERQFQILNQARKKTTQKVNLYEKVQIPQYQNAIRMVKRFLEDKENLSKAAQKMVKKRHDRKEAAA